MLLVTSTHLRIKIFKVYHTVSGAPLSCKNNSYYKHININIDITKVCQ